MVVTKDPQKANEQSEALLALTSSLLKGTPASGVFEEF